MELSKEEVLSILKSQPNGNIEEYNFKKKFPKIYQEVLSMSFPEDFKFTQKLFHYFHNDPELKLGLCPVCGKRCKFQKFGCGYSHHCSLICARKDPNTQKIRSQTCLEKFGCSNISQLDNIKNKKRETYILHFGVEHPSKLEKIKNKKVNTFRKHYSVDYYFQTEQFKEQAKQTCQEKWGVDSYTQTEECQEKMKNTCQERYGVDYYSKTNEFKQRVRNTCQERFGANVYTKSDDFKERIDEIQEKIRNTCQERFGVDNYAKTIEFSKRRVKQIPYKNLTFDSSWEVEVYKFCEDNNIPCEYQPDIQFIYEYNGKEHTYQPDFLINGKLYEVKGDQFFEDGKMINPYDRTQDELFESKHQCMIKNNIIIIRGFNIKNLREVFL